MNEPRSLFGRLFGGAQRPAARMPAEQRGRVQADDVPHARTWMSWPASRSI
ncbi:hypothetical protein [Streptacidiphilus sp. MAP5-3]|uniref:hypothetical protein n=1 Tax=unclassified Streptacidiphilus TaxID=2643834 RepID=UPI0035197399